jgi:predicted house-cleaning noncanonical NTP pyrophosphatase (MazG superfamily)
MKNQFNKLVRDRIPALIEESGRTQRSRVMDEAEYRDALLNKVVEEIEEFRLKENEEEIADIYEALDCLVRLKGFEPMHIDYIQLVKREARGSYNDRILLIEADDTARE